MQRAGMRGFGRPQRGGTTIKDRLGFQTQSRQKALAVGKRPAVTTGVKTRLGGVAAATIGQILDARQKINLNRVKKGRIGDARDKIEAKRRGKTGNKFKNLTITATVANPQANMGMRGGYYPEEPRQAAPNARFTAGYPMEASGGMFRSAAMDVYNPPGGPPSNNYGQDDGLFLTRTISNPAATAPTNYPSYSHPQRSPLQSKPNIPYKAPVYSAGPQHSEPMDEDELPSRHMSLRLAPPANTESRYKVLVSNLQASVTSDDIVELFGDIGRLLDARLTAAGHAEVTYTKKSDALKAVEAYHNRLLDGSPMRVFLENNGSSAGVGTTLKSAAGASMKLPKASSSVKIQPDISAIHKVLFNPSSSSATRGLFKGGQGQ